MSPATVPSQTAVTTVFLFGDQTESWVDGLDQLYKQASKTPWLQSFLDRLAAATKAEIAATSLDRKLLSSLGHFTSLQELGERYRHTTDELGFSRCLLLHAVAAGTLLQWIKQDPQLIGRGARTEWLGISGGLLSLSALAIGQDFDSLCDASIEVGRLLVRVCTLASTRSRAVEEEPGCWGWAVLGIAPDDLRRALHQFQQNNGIPALKRAKVAVTGAGWSTIIGPPSVLQFFVDRCPTVKTLAKNPISEIRAFQHVLDLSPADFEFMLGNNMDFLGRPLGSPDHAHWGMDHPAASYANWGELLQDVCAQVLMRPLDITQAVGKLNDKLTGVGSVRLVQAGSSSHAPYVASVLKSAGTDISVQDPRALLSTEDGSASSKSGRIAIVGMAGRGPKSANVDQFWDVIMSKEDCSTEIPKERFDVNEFFCSAHEREDKRCKMSTRYGCFMDNPGHFDSRFFHISPREAMLMDPGHRQFLMSAYEAMEGAGYSDGQTRTTDPNRIATFFAQCTDEWLQNIHPSLGCDAYTLQGVQRAFGPGRLAWQFKWEGPTYSMDSACAGATAGIHLACMSLLTKDIDMAVAGASNVLSWPHTFTCLSDAGVLSDTGNCKPFRDDADGYCKADFVGAVVLKRLEDAIAHNDNILGIISGSGRNHSGNSSSITTSDAAAQQRLFQKVMRNAQTSPDDIGYVEMHGTGTQVGDPAEMGAVANTFKHRSRRNGSLPVGGVKGNVGHSEAAAGMSELLKCIMMFHRDTIPPQAGMPHPLNPKFPLLTDINIDIPSEPRAFPKTSKKPRRILLNNFDAAGGNACMVLEDYTLTRDRATDPRSCHIIATSARTRDSHDANRQNLVKWLRDNPSVRIEDLAYTTTARRMQHPIRFACAASSTTDLIAKLESAGSSLSSSSQKPAVVFVFTGQGSHYAGMGAELYQTSPVFGETVDLCEAIAERHGFPSFLDIITSDSVDVSTKDAAQIQLAIVSLEIALTAFWRSIGIEPNMVMGHSLGEYAALHAAGVLSLADTLYLVGNRALMLLERCDPGSCAMLAVSTSASNVQDVLAKRPHSTCSIACFNSPKATVVSGIGDDLAQLQEDVSIQDPVVRTTTLSVPFAFHSFQMDPVLQDYASIASGVTYSKPRIPVASTLLGSVVDSAGIFNQDYLVRQTRRPVDFISALHAIKSELSDPFWLEVGPAAVCTSFVKATLSPQLSKVTATLEAKSSAWQTVSKTLATAYMNHVDVDWLALHKPYEKDLKLQTLPAYAWDMKNYWLTWTEPAQEMVPDKLTAAAHEPYIATCAQYLVHRTSSPHISVTLRARVGDPAFMALIDGHKMQQIGLASGSVFCEAALVAAKYALEYGGRNNIAESELTCHDPALLLPLTRDLVGTDGELVTTATVSDPSSNTVSVSFKATSGKTSGKPSLDIGSITIKVINAAETQAEWDRTSYFVRSQMDRRISMAKEGTGHRMQPDIFYALFNNAVEFSAAFRGVQEAYIAPDFQEAAAVIALPDQPHDTKFVQSPYWGEALVHLAGFMVNGNPSKPPHKTFMVMGFESAQQTVTFEQDKQYLTYTRVARWERDTAFCEAYVFELDSSKMIMQVRGLRYQELPAATWRHILEGSHEGSKSGNSASHSVKTAPKDAKRNVTATDAPGQVPPADTLGGPANRGGQAKEAPDTGVLELILDSVAKSTGTDPAEFSDDTVLADLGVDSIMAIEVVGAVKNSASIDLPAQFVFEYPTIGDLRRAFGAISATQDTTDALYPPAASDQDSPTPDSLDSDDPVMVSKPGTSSSPSSSLVSTDKDATQTPEPPMEALTEKLKQSHEQAEIKDTSPQPSVRLTLLQGRAGGKTPLYMMADGTGSIATYLHLPKFTSKLPVYGIDSPFLQCPSRLTSEVGIPGVARLVVQAILKAQPAGTSCHIGGFSAGCMVAFEVCRQLGAAGRKVDGLVLIDLCSPRPTRLEENAILAESKVGVDIFKAAVAADGLWSTSASTEAHLDAYFLAMRLYNPPAMTAAERPGRMAVIWAEKGLVNRVADNENVMQMLKDEGIPTKAYQGYMEDPKLSPMACLVPDKTEADLGPNGWEKYYAGKEVLALSVAGATHLDLPMPGKVHLLHEQMERVLEHFGI